MYPLGPWAMRRSVRPAALGGNGWFAQGVGAYARRMVIEEIDVESDEQVRAYWEATKEADGFERPYAAFWSLSSATVALRDRDAPFQRHPLAAVEDGEVIGTGQVTLPQLDNTHLAFVGVNVRPAHRRKGMGAALLGRVLEMVREFRRTTVITEVNTPLADPPESAGSHFFERHGFARASLEIHRVLDLPVAAAHLESLERDVSAHHAGYDIVSFADRVPDEHLDGFCALQSAFNSEVPMGDLDIEPEVWDESRVRAGEEQARRMGRHRQATIAVTGGGQVVALTEMFSAEGQPDIGWQSGTLVLPDHRGHRLGMTVKLANLRRYETAFPAVRVVHSWNGEQNGPMVAINDALGFRPVEYLVEMQRVM